MHKKFIQFLFERAGNKIDDLRDAGTHDEVLGIIDDLETYMDTLKEIVVEVVKL